VPEGTLIVSGQGWPSANQTRKCLIRRWVPLAMDGQRVKDDSSESSFNSVLEERIMTQSPIDDADARTLRGHWFQYLDTLEPFRRDLFGYCRKLTGTLWDAEDLVQETLLKGFGMTARGDFHGPGSPVRNLKAYLFRTATNLWLDDRRRQQRLVLTAEPTDDGQPDPDTASVREAIAHTRAQTSPAEFASLLLKDLYEFSIDDIADFIGTTPGTVKSALHRARGKARSEDAPPVSVSAADRALAEAFAEAITSQDVNRVMEMMAKTLQIEVCNVGGGRGRGEVWTRPSIAGVRAETAELQGECVVVMLRDGRLYDVLRLAGAEGQVTRITDYCYAPEVLKEAADALGYPCDAVRYHQGADVLPGMISTTTLPWQTG